MSRNSISMIVPNARIAGKQLKNSISPEANRYKWELAKEIDNYNQYGRNWDAMRGMNLDPKQREAVSNMLDLMQQNMTDDQREQIRVYLDDLRDNQGNGIPDFESARQIQSISDKIGTIASFVQGAKTIFHYFNFITKDDDQ